MEIEDFPLAWRWNQAEHNVLPIEVLAALIPLDLEAARIFSEGVPAAPAGNWLKFDASNKQLDARKWFVSLKVPDQRVIISWSENMALSLPWVVFCKYWDDFCYPTSDDVDIFLENKHHFLRWSHFELFEHNPSAL